MTGGNAANALILDPGRAAQVVSLPASLLPDDGPVISCIMATRGRIEPARHAIACFRRQTYPRRELVIACATPDSEVAAYVAGDPAIRLIEVPEAGTVGALRNAAIAEAAGSLLCVWDDDDLSHPCRLRWQLEALIAAGAAACIFARILLWWPDRSWIAVSASRNWENCLLVHRDALGAYPDVARGGDTILVAALRATRRIVAIDRPTGYCYVAHGGNLWSEAHFDRLFANASESHSGGDYAAALSRLRDVLPIDAYLAGRGG